MCSIISNWYGMLAAGCAACEDLQVLHQLVDGGWWTAAVADDLCATKPHFNKTIMTASLRGEMM